MAFYTSPHRSGISFPVSLIAADARAPFFEARYYRPLPSDAHYYVGKMASRGRRPRATFIGMAPLPECLVTFSISTLINIAF